MTITTVTPSLIEAARLVVERWEKGDLAGAVRALDAALDDVPASEIDSYLTGVVCPRCGYDEGFSLDMEGTFSVEAGKITPANGTMEDITITQASCGKCGREFVP